MLALAIELIDWSLEAALVVVSDEVSLALNYWLRFDYTTEVLAYRMAFVEAADDRTVRALGCEASVIILYDWWLVIEDVEGAEHVAAVVGVADHRT